jgi:hypothetical protein
VQQILAARHRDEAVIVAMFRNRSGNRLNLVLEPDGQRHELGRAFDVDDLSVLGANRVLYEEAVREARGLGEPEEDRERDASDGLTA